MMRRWRKVLRELNRTLGDLSLATGPSASQASGWHTGKNKACITVHRTLCQLDHKDETILTDNLLWLLETAAMEARSRGISDLYRARSLKPQ